jgi:transposase
VRVITKSCAGIDVHKETVKVCVRTIDGDEHLVSEVRTFSTMTRALLALSEWLTQNGVTRIAMESTGVYWKPVWNILESGFEIILVNAEHIKKVPGRKTDVKDCEWIAELLQYGLLTASFVPPEPIRELRDLTRHRAKLVGDKSSTINRVHKVLEDANIKLASVATDVMGVSGRLMLKAIIDGVTDASQLAGLARGRLQVKIPKLVEALEGRITKHHRFLLGMHLKKLEFLESQIEELDKHIEEQVVPFEWAVQLLDTIPGVDRCTAFNLIAEIGVNMDQFASAKHLASWAAVCPGNNESAGKRKSGKTRKGDRWLRRSLAEASWAASRTKNTYLSTQYRRLVSRKGKKRAVVALSHTILTSAFHMLKNRMQYQDLGNNYFESIKKDYLKRYHINHLKRLGFDVKVEPAA